MRCIVLQCDSHICHTKVREQCVEVRSCACIALCCSATHTYVTRRFVSSVLKCVAMRALHCVAVRLTNTSHTQRFVSSKSSTGKSIRTSQGNSSWAMVIEGICIYSYVTRVQARSNIYI